MYIHHIYFPPQTTPNFHTPLPSHSISPYHLTFPLRHPITSLLPNPHPTNHDYITTVTSPQFHHHDITVFLSPPQRVLRALDKTWHKEHFFCTLCGKNFGSEGFHEKDGKAFCRECYYEKFAPKCKRCDKAIMEGFITALSSQWHPECFCCKVRVCECCGVCQREF